MTRIPLRYLTVLILLVFIALSTLLAYRFGLAAAEHHVETAEARNLEGLAQRLQYYLGNPLEQDRQPPLHKTLQTLGGDRDINLAVILDGEGRVLAGMDTERSGEPWETLTPHRLDPSHYPDLSITARLEGALGVGTVYTSESGNSLLAAFPVSHASADPDAQASGRGLMLIQLDLTPAMAAARHDVRELVLRFIGFLTLLAALGLIFFHWTVTKRVERLARAMRRFSSGDLNACSGITGGDELADLGRTFDQMVIHIAETQQTLRERDQRLLRAKVTLDSIGDAVVTTDADGHVDYLNPAAEKLTGWPLVEARGKRPDEMFQLVNETSGATVRTPLHACLREGRSVGLANHIVMITREGRTRAVEDSAAPIRDPQGTTIGAVLVFHDVTRPRQLARKLSWQATHDPLTGVFNRFEFERRLQVALKQAREIEAHHALLYMDLDQFKVVNDTCGHVAGDELLKQLAFNLLAKIRDSDTLARLGGDEFGVLLEHCPRDKALEIADHLRQTVRQFRFVWQGRVFEVGISIGVVLLESAAEDMNAVLSAADMACFAAKERGRDRIHVYHPDDQELIQRYGEMEAVSRINQALADHRFRLYLQPIIPVSNPHHPPHQEILLRMLDEEGRVVMPWAFIPAAERFGLMPAVDRWVVHHFFVQFAQSLKDDPGGEESSSGTVYAINLSGASLSDDQLPGFVIQQLERYQIPASRICFEITETAAIANLTRAKLFMNELRQRGCRFALDDFGTGLSSFTYLKQLPVDYLKIDGSLVKDIARNPIDRSMVDAIARIGRVMGLHTIAEFVEDEAVLATLAELGVDFAQGYGVARPAPLSQVAPFQSRPAVEHPPPGATFTPRGRTRTRLPNTEV